MGLVGTTKETSGLLAITIGPPLPCPSAPRSGTAETCLPSGSRNDYGIYGNMAYNIAIIQDLTMVLIYDVSVESIRNKGF